jgi:hypothetical protein
MSIQSLSSVFQTVGTEKTIELLSDNVTISEKLNGFRIYCKKEVNNNVKFYTNKSSKQITIIDRLLDRSYDKFIKFIIENKHKLSVGEYGFYITNNSVFGNVKNDMILTNCPQSVNINEIANELNVSLSPYIVSDKLNKTFIKLIIKVLENKKSFTDIIKKFNFSYLPEALIFEINNSFYKLENSEFKKTIYEKRNTAAYELLLLELFDYISTQNIYEIKTISQNRDIRFIEFVSELFNRFIRQYSQTDSLSKLYINIPDFIKHKGNLTSSYISNNETLKHIEDINNDYILRTMIVLLKDTRQPRGLITEGICTDINNIVININEFVTKSNQLLDYSEFKKFKL